MHKSELKTHPTLISHANKEYELKVGTIGTYRNTIESQHPLELNSKIDSTSHYKELIALLYPMYITTRHQVFRSVTYYPCIQALHELVHHLTR